MFDGPSLGVGKILGPKPGVDHGKKAGAFLVDDVIEVQFKAGWLGGYTVILGH